MNTYLRHALVLLDEHKLQYRVQHSPADAESLMWHLHPTENRLQVLVETINAEMPRMDFGPNNPNTGHTHHNIWIGRESSRVIYLTFIKTYMPRDFDYGRFGERMARLAKMAGTDEFSIAWDNTECWVRFWWD